MYQFIPSWGLRLHHKPVHGIYRILLKFDRWKAVSHFVILIYFSFFLTHKNSEHISDQMPFCDVNLSFYQSLWLSYMSFLKAPSTCPHTKTPHEVLKCHNVKQKHLFLWIMQMVSIYISCASSVCQRFESYSKKMLKKKQAPYKSLKFFLIKHDLKAFDL